MKNNHNVFNAIHKPTGCIVTVFLTHEEIHLKKTMSSLLHVYLDKDGEIIPTYVKSSDLEFIFDVDQQEELPSTKKTG